MALALLLDKISPWRQVDTHTQVLCALLLDIRLLVFSVLWQQKKKKLSFLLGKANVPVIRVPATTGPPAGATPLRATQPADRLYGERWRWPAAVPPQQSRARGACGTACAGFYLATASLGAKRNILASLIFLSDVVH